MQNKELRMLAAGVSVLLLASLLWIGCRVWRGIPDGSGEWITVNREMNDLLGAGTPGGGEGGAGAAPGREPVPAHTMRQPSGAKPALSMASDEAGEAASGSAEAVTSSSTAQASGSNRININTATLTRLKELPGIGESKARAIIAYRDDHGPFRSAEELMKVKGIGAKTFESLQDRIAVSP